MLLGDMGADVIKVESPGKGDDSRHWGESVQGQSPVFLQYNRNKRSLTLNLRSAEGRAILLKLLERADVLLENFRPGTMEKMGVSYERAAAANPRLIYCSVSGFGQTGPYSRLGGYDAIIQAMSGVMSVNGEQGSPPLRVGLPITDILAAQSAAYAVALAIVARERTGEGQKVDVSLFE
jgi:crotonobetainyl-CoA:carnitine CoA-transferase CaiB-like acyl-CoA transferase